MHNIKLKILSILKLPIIYFCFVFYSIDKIIHFKHFDRNLFMRSFGSDDSWDKLLIRVGGGGRLLKFF